MTPHSTQGLRQYRSSAILVERSDNLSLQIQPLKKRLENKVELIGVKVIGDTTKTYKKPFEIWSARSLCTEQGAEQEEVIEQDETQEDQLDSDSGNSVLCRSINNSDSEEEIASSLCAEQGAEQEEPIDLDGTPSMTLSNEQANMSTTIEPMDLPSPRGNSTPEKSPTTRSERNQLDTDEIDFTTSNEQGKENKKIVIDVNAQEDKKDEGGCNGV